MLGQIVSNSIKYSSDSPMLTISMIHSETILDRVKDSHDRPLIENNKTVPFIAELMEKRREKYEAAADIVIETDGKDKLQICEELIHRLRQMDNE